ncbi:MAG: sensor histidine kinase [Cellulosilyticaceae bacterium]
MIKAWLYKRKNILALVGTMSVLIWVVPVLYKTNLEPMYYTLQLIGIMLLMVGSYDFYRFYTKAKSLEKVYEGLEVELKPLPEPQDLIEVTYQEMIYKLDEIAQHTKRQVKKQTTEMTDYYTLWAHQIKVPITAMDLLIQSEDFISRRQEMGQELFKIENYVEMVLQYLRIESMASDMMIKKYELYPIIKKVIKKYSSLFISRKISLQLESFELGAYTDEKWLSFVLEQIIANSLKYTHTGSIIISVCPSIPNTLVIEDKGIGIKSEDLPRLFDKGFTGYNGRMDKKATGIGLYLCKSVCDRLTHEIRITSEEGKGTKVYLTFRDQADDFILQN